MYYVKFASVDLLPDFVLKFYLVAYTNRTLISLTNLSHTELTNLVQKSELERRPNRSFCIIFAIPETEPTWTNIVLSFI